MLRSLTFKSAQKSLINKIFFRMSQNMDINEMFFWILEVLVFGDIQDYKVMESIILKKNRLIINSV